MSKPLRLNVWHRMILDIMKSGKLNTNEIVGKMKERRCPLKESTIRGQVFKLHTSNYLEEIETERAADKGGRMTVRVWRLSEAAAEKG